MKESLKEGVCPIYRTPCIGDKCPAWQFIPNAAACCPLLINPDALEVVKESMMMAMRYLDEVSGIERGSPGDPMAKLRAALKSGNIDWKRIFTDAAELLSEGDDFIG